MRSDAAALSPPHDDIGALRALCDAHSRHTTVTAVDDGGPDWTIDDAGCLRNLRTDYFSIGLYRAPSGAPLTLMRQAEKALVMLLVADFGGRPAVLLSVRTEPGLIGLTNLTATIQSTPSNFLRRHGGRATPFIEVADDPHAHGEVLYDGEQFDWGGHYLRKTKRYLVVRLPIPEAPPPGSCWVDLHTAFRAMHEPYLVTNDLRVCLAYVPDVSGPPPEPAQPANAEAAAPMARLAFDPGRADAQGTTVAFFRTVTQTREVHDWVQPLLVAAAPMTICWACINGARGRVFAAQDRTQPGLLGQRVAFPVAAPGGAVLRSVATSAEGGRFWRYRINLQLQELPSQEALGALEAHAPIRWLAEAELAAWVRAPLRTSLELRLAWSLVCGDA